ncbi:MAG: PAS domain S-box protein [Bacteroidia bacterium]|nr:PAS domain S-box protein [Bacteroidia bacterium]
MSTGIAYTNSEGQILHCNQAFESFLGYRTGDLFYTNILDLVQAEQKVVLHKELTDALDKTENPPKQILFIKNNQEEAYFQTEIKQAESIDNVPIFTILISNVLLTREAFGQEEQEESLFETIIKHSKDPIIISDAKPDGRVPDIIYANQAFCDMCGYTREEIIGNQPSMLGGTETNLNDLIKVVEAIKNEEEGVFELLNYKKDGTKFWVQFSILPLKNKEGKTTHWVAFEKDITKNKEQHDLLVESEAKYRSLVQNSSVGIYILNANGFSFVNKKLCEITGYSEEELTQLPLTKLIHANDYFRVHKQVQNRLLGINIEPDNNEFRIIRKDGVCRWLEAHGSRLIINGTPSIIGIITDSTERRESEEKIRKFSQAIEQSAASIIITNLASEIEYVNPAFINITGYKKEEIIGENPRILKTEFNEKNSHIEMWEALNQDKSWRGVFLNKKKNGETFWEQVVISPVFDSAGNKTNYVAVKDDITKRILLEEEKEKLIEELTISLNELQQFTYITSHNLRAPITNLVGILDLLEWDKIKDQTTLELLEGFKKSTLKINETLEDLIETLIIKSKSNLKYQNIQFHEVLNSVKQSINQIIKENKTQIEADFTEAPEYFLVKTYVESIFQNLITNSIKYAKPGVPAHIKIKSTYNKEGKLVLSFSDNGIGLNMEKIKDRIFGLYQKFHKNKDSKGMGLFLVKSHVHAMNGNIELTSEINKGTTVTIIIDK